MCNFFQLIVYFIVMQKVNEPCNVQHLVINAAVRNALFKIQNYNKIKIMKKQKKPN